jgi:hypothetical protein
MRRIAATLIGALCVARPAAAQPPAPSATPPRAQSPKSAAPDLAFLEYLGSWQGNDDEWLAIKEWDQDGAPKDAAEKPQDSAAKPKEPAPQRAGNDHDKGQ